MESSFKPPRLMRLIAGAVLFGLFAGGQVCTAKEKADLLLISSYHPDFPTFYQQIGGIREVLPADAYHLDVEFMDSKRFPDAETAAAFEHYLEGKLERLPDYDLVFAADDNALRFSIEHKEALFPGIPLVFLGVNDLALAARMNDEPEVTGVVEAASMRETIELALQLQPGLKRVYAVSDATTSGAADLAAFLELRKQFADIELAALDLGAESWDGLAEQLSVLPSDSAVLLLSAYRDADNAAKTFSESLRLIVGHSPVPVYHLWEHGLGGGIVGGVVISHHEQGKAAAGLARQLLEGAAVESVPVELTSPNRSVLDYNVLKARGIDFFRLPPSVEVINRPASFYREHRQLFWFFMAVFFMMAAFIITLSFNIMKRHRIEKELQRSEQLFKVLFNELIQLCALLRPDGTVVRINDSALRMRSLSSDDVVGHSFWETPWWRDSGYEQKVQDAVRRAAEGETVRFLVSHENPYLGEVTIDFSLKPILEGRQTLLLAEGRDISELQRMQDKLQQNEKMDAIGQLAGGVAHDFNNMLGGIMGFGELLEMELSDDDPKLKEYAGHIVSSCRRAAQLTGQLLSFARKGRRQTVSVNLKQISEDAILLLERGIDKKIRITTSYPGEALYAAGDPGQLQSAVLNLGLNARDAMPDGGSLNISVRRKEIDAAYCQNSRFDLLPGGYAAVEVRDTGHGIPPAQLERVFEPFFTTKAVGKGTGLGLAAVYGAVKEHLGELTVSSEVGKGTSFRILLPLAGGSGSDEAVPLPQRIPAAESRTILIIEDEADFRMLLESVLKSLGYETLTAENGRAGVERYKQNRDAVDLCLVDAVMPEFNGMETLQQIRVHNPEARILIMSGYSADTTRSDYIKAGAEAFLAKPCSIAELSLAIHRLLGGGQG